MKNDRRIKYTKLMLKDSLTELLLVKPISKITIKEICEKADINRGTFYAHYASQFDLLESVVNDYLKNIEIYLQEYQTTKNLYESVTLIFQYIEENSSLTQAIFSLNSDIDISKKITTFIDSVYTNEPSLSMVTNIPEKQEIYAYITSGVFGVIQNWIQSENKKTPQDMARIVTTLINYGVSSFIAQI